MKNACDDPKAEAIHVEVLVQGAVEVQVVVQFICVLVKECLGKNRKGSENHVEKRNIPAIVYCLARRSRKERKPGLAQSEN